MGDFAEGLAAGYKFSRQMAMDSDLRGAADNVRQETLDQYTPEQAQQIQSAANAGGLSYDADRGGYVTGDGGLIAPTRQYTLGGLQQQQAFSPQQLQAARQLAQADVYQRYGLQDQAQKIAAGALAVQKAQRSNDDDASRDTALANARAVYVDLTSGDPQKAAGALKKVSDLHSNSPWLGGSRSSVTTDPQTGAPHVVLYPEDGSAPQVKAFDPKMALPLALDYARAQLSLATPEGFDAERKQGLAETTGLAAANYHQASADETQAKIDADLPQAQADYYQAHGTAMEAQADVQRALVASGKFQAQAAAANARATKSTAGPRAPAETIAVIGKDAQGQEVYGSNRRAGAFYADGSPAANFRLLRDAVATRYAMPAQVTQTLPDGTQVRGSPAAIANADPNTKIVNDIVNGFRAADKGLLERKRNK